MKRIIAYFMIYCLCTSIVFVSTDIFTHADAQKRGSIRGYVVDDIEEAIIGARIHLNNLPWTVETNIEGYFEINNLPVGTYELRIMHDIYYEEASYRVDVKAGVVHNLRVKLHASKEVFERQQP